mmetsp:Transcript_20471/g.28174  ORF Transcript_20471/g.28174 Transcript_20471/m.28174 type:complete len:251 (+) Transcript_20471:632-1384(+)
MAAEGARQGLPLRPAAQRYQFHRDGHGRSELCAAALLRGLPPPRHGGHLQLPHSVHPQAHSDLLCCGGSQPAAARLHRAGRHPTGSLLRRRHGKAARGELCERDQRQSLGAGDALHPRPALQIRTAGRGRWYSGQRRPGGAEVGGGGREWRGLQAGVPRIQRTAGRHGECAGGRDALLHRRLAAPHQGPAGPGLRRADLGLRHLLQVPRGQRVRQPRRLQEGYQDHHQGDRAAQRLSGDHPVSCVDSPSL